MVKNHKQKDDGEWERPLHFEGEERHLPDGRHSLVFHRTAPSKVKAREGDEERLEEVEKALRACGGAERHIPTKVLARQIVEAQLAGDAALREKTEVSGSLDTLVGNEAKKLRRQTKDKKAKGKVTKGLLKHLVQDVEASNLLWSVPTNVVPFPGKE